MFCRPINFLSDLQHSVGKSASGVRSVQFPIQKGAICYSYRKFGLLFLCLLCALHTNAHIIPYELDPREKMGTWALFLQYLGTGYRHILPDGFDHILFILCVFFLSKDIKKVVIQATAFTTSHTITLALGMYGFISPPASVVEPLIALSIVALALENVFSDKVKPWRIILVFLFGLVHGMGFAAGLIEKLQENGLARNEFVLPLAGFSLGVESGQLTIILFLYFAVSRPFSCKPWYRKRIVIPVSIIVAMIASYWTIQRIFFTP